MRWYDLSLSLMEDVYPSESGLKILLLVYTVKEQLREGNWSSNNTIHCVSVLAGFFNLAERIATRKLVKFRK